MTLLSNNAAFLDKMPHNPFDYDLGVTVIPSVKKNDKVTLCCHGYGHSNKLVDVLHANHAPLGTLIGFNFPDHDINSGSDHAAISYGSAHEILPLIYLLKYYVCDLNQRAINVYGFSAGGGAIINALVALTTDRYDSALTGLGITPQDKNKIMSALHDGVVILDCPLKSVAEIIALRGKSSELNAMARNFANNDFEPINALEKLHNPHLTIILYFEKGDTILSNRDDDLFYGRLVRANKGKTTFITGRDGGHNSYHRKLWDYIKTLK